jgi:oxygen-dependent protoporphyrinogen oxidase
MKRVVIVGGGIGGLATAYSLVEGARERGIEPPEITMIERGERVGGNIITVKEDGFLIEGGPDCFLSEKPWAMALCKKLGLEDSLLPTVTARGRTFVLSGGKLHLLPEGVILMVPTKMLPLITSSLISWPGKIRMGLEMFIPKRKEKGDETLGSFVRRRLGKEALQKIAGPLVAGVHAGDPETMSIKASFPKFVAMEEEYGSLIKGMIARMASMKGLRGNSGKLASGKRPTMFMTLSGGLTQMVQAILDRIKIVKIKTSTSVSNISEVNGGYELEIENTGTGEAKGVITADSVVIAAPAHAASRLTAGFDAALSEKLTSIPYVSTATVSVGFKKDELGHPLDGFGFVVPAEEGRRIMAASWVSSKWAGRAPDGMALIRCFIGGAKQNDMVFKDDAEIKKVVLEELRDIMGITAEPVIVKIFRWKNAMAQYVVGHEDRINAIEADVAKHKGLYLTGSAYHGIGISDTVREAETVANKVLDSLG